LIGDDLFVTGLGFIGLLTVRIGRLAGARRIVATDPFEKRRSLALKLGADETLDPSDLEAAGLLKAPDGFDVAVETAGSHDALCDAMAVLRRNGRVCVVSQLRGPPARHPVLGIEFHLGELEMISADGRGDVRKLTRWYFDAVQRGDFNGVAEAITHSVPFSEIKNGFELLEREPEDVVKIVVTYD
jgi:threonine dehydrogenase-like Zn-dependent dehydrogenase